MPLPFTSPAGLIGCTLTVAEPYKPPAKCRAVSLGSSGPALKDHKKAQRHGTAAQPLRREVNKLSDGVSCPQDEASVEAEDAHVNGAAEGSEAAAEQSQEDNATAARARRPRKARRDRDRRRRGRW